MTSWVNRIYKLLLKSSARNAEFGAERCSVSQILQYYDMEKLKCLHSSRHTISDLNLMTFIAKLCD